MLDEVYLVFVDRLTRTVLMLIVLSVTVLIYKHAGATSAEITALVSTLSLSNKNND